MLVGAGIGAVGAGVPALGFFAGRASYQAIGRWMSTKEAAATSPSKLKDMKAMTEESSQLSNEM
ncbi:MAG: hypothetical protein K0U37_09500 [Gammaproteobacteria bacterium]|nr:hypothetical protein [Gammaproteobacteria bacterium]